MSCDLLPSRSAGPHYRGDVFDVVDYPWDLAICHPECTHVAVSGALHFEAKRFDGRQQSGVAFIMRLWRALDHVPMVALENPIGVLSTLWRKADQTIQPYHFGEDASKATCLWLKGLPKLRETTYVQPRIVNGKKRWANQTDSGQNKLAPSDDRAAIRATTYPGIAQAMADQWGNAKAIAAWNPATATAAVASPGRA